MEIHGHTLPDELYMLIKRGLPIFIRCDVIRKILTSNMEDKGEIFDDVPLLSFEGIKRESEWDRLLKHENLTDIYRIGSSRHRGEPITEIHTLDTDQALLIAVNLDEEAIALDYRIDPINPRVLGSFALTGWKWILLADSFAEFAEKVNLKG